MKVKYFPNCPKEEGKMKICQGAFAQRHTTFLLFYFYFLFFIFFLQNPGQT